MAAARQRTNLGRRLENNGLHKHDTVAHLAWCLRGQTPWKTGDSLLQLHLQACILGQPRGP